MNVLQCVPVLFLALGLASAAPDQRDTFSCPEMDIDFMGRDVDTVHNIGSWQDCGKQLKIVREPKIIKGVPKKSVPY